MFVFAFSSEQELLEKISLDLLFACVSDGGGVLGTFLKEQTR